MKRNRSIPPAPVIVVLSYPDVRAAVDWLRAAEPESWGGRTVTPYP